VDFALVNSLTESKWQHGGTRSNDHQYAKLSLPLHLAKKSDIFPSSLRALKQSTPVSTKNQSIAEKRKQ